MTRIHRRYATVTEPLKFGPVTLDFTRVADPNRVLDEIADEEDRREKSSGVRADQPLHLPYWAELWDSGRRGLPAPGRPVGRPAGRRVGDGLGLRPGRDRIGRGPAGGTSVVCRSRGAGPLVRPLQRRHPTGTGPGGSTGKLDHLGETFELIIGADILYDRKQWVHLEPFWAEHLSPTGSILLGEPGRPTGGMFLDWLKDRPWDVTEYEQRVPTRERPIRVFELRRR